MNDELDAYHNVLADCGDELGVLYDELDELKSAISTVKERRDDQVTEALYTIQDELEAGEEYPLVQVRQHTRSGTDRYVETLTQDGVTARQKAGRQEPRTYITSPCTDVNGNLPVEDYLDDLRGSRPMNALAERLQEDVDLTDTELPTLRRNYY